MSPCIALVRNIFSYDDALPVVAAKLAKPQLPSLRFRPQAPLRSRVLSLLKPRLEVISASALAAGKLLAQSAFPTAGDPESIRKRA